MGLYRQTSCDVPELDWGCGDLINSRKPECILAFWLSGKFVLEPSWKSSRSTLCSIIVLNPLDALGDNQACIFCLNKRVDASPELTLVLPVTAIQVTEKYSVGIDSFNCTAETFT